MTRKGKYIFFLLLLIVLTSGGLFSQSIKVISATSQGWALGVCCRQGINYNINLQVVNRKQKVKLDSLWMEGYCMDIAKYNIKKSDTSFIQIQERMSFDDGFPMEHFCFDPNKKGVVISYYQNGKKKRMDITPYIKELEFIAYP